MKLHEEIIGNKQVRLITNKSSYVFVIPSLSLNGQHLTKYYFYQDIENRPQKICQ